MAIGANPSPPPRRGFLAWLGEGAVIGVAAGAVFALLAHVDVNRQEFLTEQTKCQDQLQTLTSTLAYRAKLLQKLQAGGMDGTETFGSNVELADSWNRVGASCIATDLLGPGDDFRDTYLTARTQSEGALTTEPADAKTFDRVVDSMHWAIGAQRQVTLYLPPDAFSFVDFSNLRWPGNASYVSLEYVYGCRYETGSPDSTQCHPT